MKVSIRTRIIIGILLIVGVIFYYFINWVVKDFRSHYLKSMEESLIDTATVLSSCVSTKITHDKISIDDSIAATHLYLIAQEAVNNAIKHRKSGNISVTLSKSDKGIILSVNDDGKGLPKILDQNKGMGISIMKYRARMINAIITIEANERGGTGITCIYRNTA